MNLHDIHTTRFPLFRQLNILAGALALVLVTSTLEADRRDRGPDPERGSRREARSGGDRAEGERARHCRRGKKRWKDLDDSTREKIRQLSAHLSKLPADKRDELLRRLRGARPETLRDLLKNLRDIAELPPEKRPEALARLQDDRSHRRLCRDLERHQYQSRFKRLPDDVLEDLRQANSAEQRAILRKHLERRRKEYERRREELIASLPDSVRSHVNRLSGREQGEFLRRYMSHRLLLEVFPSETEREALLKLSPRNLHAMLRQRESERPDILAAETWKRWLELEPYERGRLVSHLHRLQGDSPHRRGSRGGCGKSSRHRESRHSERRGPGRDGREEGKAQEEAPRKERPSDGGGSRSRRG